MYWAVLVPRPVPAAARSYPERSTLPRCVHPAFDFQSRDLEADNELQCDDFHVFYELKTHLRKLQGALFEQFKIRVIDDLPEIAAGMRLLRDLAWAHLLVVARGTILPRCTSSS